MSLFRWATSAVMTRQNFVPSADGNGMITALIPMWDMANHSNGKVSIPCYNYCFYIQFSIFYDAIVDKYYILIIQAPVL